MCIVSNWVNEAQDLMAVKKYDDVPNSLIPILYQHQYPIRNTPGVTTRKQLVIRIVKKNLQLINVASDCNDKLRNSC